MGCCCCSNSILDDPSVVASARIGDVIFLNYYGSVNKEGWMYIQHNRLYYYHTCINVCCSRYNLCGGESSFDLTNIAKVEVIDNQSFSTGIALFGTGSMLCLHPGLKLTFNPVHNNSPVIAIIQMPDAHKFASYLQQDNVVSSIKVPF